MAKPENNRVLVKFHTKSPKVRDEIVRAFGIENVEIEKRSREVLRRVNENRQTKAAKQGVPQARPGMLGDTGIQVFGKYGLANVSLGEVHSDLLACGFILIGAAITQAPQVNQETGEFTDTNKQKWVVTAEYHLPGDELVQDLALVKRVEAFLASDRVFVAAHVWDNPDGSATVNLTGVQEGRPAKVNVLRYHPRRGFGEESSLPPTGMTLTAKLAAKIAAVKNG